MELSDELDVLRASTLFAGFNDDQLEAVTKVGRRRSFEEEDRIVRTGESGARSLWLILEGKVCVQLGEERILTLGPGQYFGEMALLSETSQERSADVIPMAPTTCFEFQRSHLLGLVSSTPEIAILMLGELARRLRTTTELLRRLSESTPACKAAAVELGIRASDQQLSDVATIEYPIEPEGG